MNNIFLDIFEPEIQERERKAAAAATAAVIAETYNTITERLIKRGMDGPGIADVTGYDRSRIDSIARRLNRTVSWDEARA